MFVSRLELDQRYVFMAEALVAHPFGINLLGKEMEGCFGKTCADPVEPEIAARLAQDGLVIVMYFFVANPTWVDWWSIRILRIENHRLVHRVDFLLGHGQRRSAHSWVGGGAHWDRSWM